MRDRWVQTSAPGKQVGRQHAVSSGPWWMLSNPVQNDPSRTFKADVIGRWIETRQKKKKKSSVLLVSQYCIMRSAEPPHPHPHQPPNQPHALFHLHYDAIWRAVLGWREIWEGTRIHLLITKENLVGDAEHCWHSLSFCFFFCFFLK